MNGTRHSDRGRKMHKIGRRLNITSSKHRKIRKQMGENMR
jgi:23S rRNA maturation-related 3'-5' exoribonuclease YhaM